MGFVKIKDTKLMTSEAYIFKRTFKIKENSKVLCKAGILIFCIHILQKSI